MAGTADLVVQAVVGLAAAGIGAGVTVWATVQSLRGAAAIDRAQRQDQEVAQRRSILETAASELELGAMLVRGGGFDTEVAYVPLPHGGLDRMLEYLHTVPESLSDATREAALRVAIFNSYAEASVQQGGKIARGVARGVAADAMTAMDAAASQLRSYLQSSEVEPGG